MDILSQQQLKRLLDLAKAPRDALLIRTQYETGCTVSELTQIQRSDLNDSTITIQHRPCHVSGSLLTDLKKLTQTHTSPYVFASRQSDCLTSKRVQQIVKRYLKQLDPTLEKKTPHLLRYTHIAHALAKHIPAKAIMAQTGLQELRMAQLMQELQPDTQGYGGALL